MATGLPCIAVKAGAIPELVKTDENGYLCEADDVDGVAKAMVSILSDQEKQKQMSKGSLKLVQKHDISYTLTRMEEIYEKVLAARDEAILKK
jgi:glycosyltransferase involved in cell wall biosynthesis